MPAVRQWARSLFNRDTAKQDAVAGVVLGVQSVPDGLAAGVLAGVNPVYGLYGYMVGVFSGALATSSAFMAVQATGAMAMVISDVPVVHEGDKADAALFTLAVLTGVVMLAAGLFKLGTLLRWVSNSVMVGFINAVGINIVLGQLDNFSGYEAEGANRIARTFNLLFNLGEAHWPSMAIGAATILLIVLLERTRLGALGMVVAIALTSGLVPLLGLDLIAQLSDITEIPGSLPRPVLPDLRLVPSLIIPAAALAFVGLVQGAGISANFPNPDGSYSDASRDFVGQGVANLAVGLFRGMPVGGSMSATALVTSAGAKSRAALLFSGVVMAIAVVLFSGAVGQIAMPALAGLLMLVGYRTVKPDDIRASVKTGTTQAVVMGTTFVLTMLIPLQFAVLVGVGISIVLHVVKQSGSVVVKRWLVIDGRIEEAAAPGTVGANEVLVLQPYGSLFFASAPAFEEALPEISDSTHNSVVILRLRGQADVGSTFVEVLSRYESELQKHRSRLVLILSDEKTRLQLEATGVIDQFSQADLYESDRWLGETVIRAHSEATEWIASEKPD